MIEGVIEEVNNAQKDRDYYKAISLSCSFIQFVAVVALKCLEDLGNKQSER
jgi:hypothetical protein